MIKPLVILILFAGFFLGNLYIVRLVYQDYSFQIEQNDILMKDLENLESYIDELEKTEELIRRNRTDLDLIRSAFPPDHDAPNLFFYLENQIANKNLDRTGSLGSFSVRPYEIEETEHERIKRVGFGLSFEGSYNNVKGFFEEIEQVARVMRVNTVNFSKREADRFPGFEEDDQEDDQEDPVSPPDEDLISVEIEANTYSY